MRIDFGRVSLRLENVKWVPATPTVLARHNDVRLVGKQDMDRCVGFTVEYQDNDDMGQPRWRRIESLEGIADGLARLLLRMIQEERARLDEAAATLVRDRDQEAGRS